MSKSWLPGDPRPTGRIARMIRVDHAGEVGATRIYAGQLAVMGKSMLGSTIRHMADQEAKHKAAFDRLMVERRVRPTLLAPFWHVAGYALGAATALMGPRAAMACTVAIETEIDRHYGRQLVELGDGDPALVEAIDEFRADEAEHREIALAAGAERAPGYPLLSRAIRFGCRAAIALSRRI